MYFKGETYSFDGKLQNGEVLNEDAVWYVAGFFKQDDIFVSVNSFGRIVYYSTQENNVITIESRDSTSYYDAPGWYRKSV